MTNAYLQRVVHRHNISSNYLDEPRNILVYLPPGFNELISYPVLYTQDGEEFFNLGRIATQANRLILENDIDPLVIVGVFTDKRVRTEEYGPGYPRNENYIRFIMEDVLPFVESHYPVRTNRTDRVLTGDSLGATFSMTLALSYLNEFGKVLSLSGAYFERSLRELDQAVDLSSLEIYQLIGTEEIAVDTHKVLLDFVKANREYHRALVEKGAKVKYVEKPGVHTWGFWQKELADSLRYFFGT